MKAVNRHRVRTREEVASLTGMSAREVERIERAAIMTVHARLLCCAESDYDCEECVGEWEWCQREK